MKVHLAVAAVILTNVAIPALAESTMRIHSSAFKHNGAIPTRHTCEGEDLSPPLNWTEIPPAAKSLALIVDDPDAPDPAAPRMTWVHWLVYNLPAAAGGLPENAGPLPACALEGTNDFRHVHYGGPCPPVGRHHYFFKLYALDTVFPDLRQPNKARLEQAMKGHILAETQLVGTYQKK